MAACDIAADRRLVLNNMLDVCRPCHIGDNLGPGKFVDVTSVFGLGAHQVEIEYSDLDIISSVLGSTVVLRAETAGFQYYVLFVS